MNKIFTKMIGGYVAITIIFSLTLFFSFDFVKTFYLESLQRNLERFSLTIEDRVRACLLEDKLNELNDYVTKIGKKTETRITIVATDGKVLADSEANPAKMENHATRPEIAYAFSNDEFGSSLRHSATVDADMLYVAYPIKRKGKPQVVIRTSVYASDINKVVSKIKANILELSLAAFLLAAIVIFVFSRRMTGPLEDLTKASEKVASGDFSAKVFVNKKDEIKTLADNFNAMTERISGLFERLSSQKEELYGIISSMNEGLAVIDESGVVVLGNRSFRKIVQSEEVEGKNYWELMRDEKISKLFKKVKKKKQFRKTEAQIKGKYYSCSANYIDAKNEIAIVFFDVSEAKTVSDMKKDFIVNVSHELRTPLTAIQGFVETLEEEVGERQKKYLEIIKRHAHRLILILKDLLRISELEDKSVELDISEIDFDSLLEDVTSIFEQKAKEKNIDIKVEIADELPAFKGDYYKLEQLFINLIDNSIKYTDEGWVKIKIEPSDGDINISISDTGIGIPETHLNRIFERFYRVDKSRSRKNGGTGLGLSIVKHIAKLHNGELRVKSEQGKGTEFIVRLPMG